MNSKTLRTIGTAVGVILLVALVAVFAKTPAPTAPTLTDPQKLQLRVLVQQMEIAQLRAQVAQGDFDRAQAAIRALADQWKVAGYELDLATLAYVKTPAAPTPPPK